MALWQAGLGARLLRVLAGQSRDPSAVPEQSDRPPGLPSSAGDAGRRWAHAYRHYAEGAVADASLLRATPVTVDLDRGEARLGERLEAAFAAASAADPGLEPRQVVDALTAALAAAFVAFWRCGTDGVAFTAGRLYTGRVEPLPEAAGLARRLRIVLDPARPSPEAAVVAADLAGALHAWTSSLTVTITPVRRCGPPLSAVQLR